MKGKISKHSVENLSCERKDHFLWDTELPMFGCKITPKGRRVYLLQYRINGRLRRYTIGRHGILTAREARHLARKMLHEVVLGRDPADTKKNKGDQNDKLSPGPPKPVVNKTKSVSSGEKPEIPGYSLEEVIFESSRTRLWRGRRQSDELSVLIKGSASPQQSAQELAEMRHEHEITQALKIDGVLKSRELVRCENGWALILENTEGLPLRKLMDAARFELLDSLKVALSLTGILKEAHRQGILHKMINPFNIFVDPATGTVKLTGFGLATRLHRENSTTLSPQLSEETLPYISPEQTGRMNRPLDYRSDFYSLGATLYELFSGRVPFWVPGDHGNHPRSHCPAAPVPLDQVAPPGAQNPFPPGDETGGQACRGALPESLGPFSRSPDMCGAVRKTGEPDPTFLWAARTFLKNCRSPRGFTVGRMKSPLWRLSWSESAKERPRWC